ncbi:hypothetical protein DRJ54_03280 [Candidatus Acetothermia bacterium]|nr:MAG: hypothetical protein DRJ54_03280 [Candidatus Acetothermia bacterium]
MTGIPDVPGDRVVKALRKAGWELLRTKGSHVILGHKDFPQKLILVPVHGGKSLTRGTLARILKEAGLSPEEFKRLV